MKTSLGLLFFSLSLILLDQALKFSFSVISICNKNIAWSIPVSPGVFYFFWIFIFIFLILLFFKSTNYFGKIFLIFIISGAASNVIDRIRFGCVLDYMDLKFWPVFNLADVYITMGIILLIIFHFKFKILNEF
jgi:signal peptidase II